MLNRISFTTSTARCFELSPVTSLLRDTASASTLKGVISRKEPHGGACGCPPHIASQFRILRRYHETVLLRRGKIHPGRRKWQV
jgi:hypothetical protein